MAEVVGPEQLVFLKWPRDVDPASVWPSGEGVPLPNVRSESLEETRGQNFPEWDRVCLLDMKAEDALQPEDDASFDAVVFGGILGNVIEGEDGSYSSDDRTSEVRRLGFTHRRHLGPMQMTTDTAVLVAKKVLEEAMTLSEIPFLD